MFGSNWTHLFSIPKKEEIKPKEIVTVTPVKEEICNQINIEIAGPHKDTYLFKIDAIFMEAIPNGDGSGFSKFKESTYSTKGTPKSEYLEKICDSYKERLQERLKSNDCPIDLSIYLHHKDHDPIIIKENSISLEKFWEHYDSVINSLLSFKNNLTDRNRPHGP
jgi:hypothetical protein